MFLIMRLWRLSGGFIPGEVRERQTHNLDSAARDNKYVRIKELWHLFKNCESCKLDAYSAEKY